MLLVGWNVMVGFEVGETDGPAVGATVVGLDVGLLDGLDVGLRVSDGLKGFVGEYDIDGAEVGAQVLEDLDCNLRERERVP